MQQKYEFTRQELNTFMHEIGRIIFYNLHIEASVNNFEVTIDSMDSKISQEDILEVQARLNGNKYLDLLPCEFDKNLF